MGITKRPSGKWRATVYLDDGTQRSRHFDKRQDAARFEADHKAARNRGNWIDPSNRTTVAEYALQWAATRPHRPSTAKNTQGLIKNHLANEPLGKLRLSRVRPSDLQGWATGRSKVMSPLRLRNALGMVRSMFAAAVDDHLIGSNPATRVAIPRYEKARIVPLTPEQVWALAEAVPDRNRAMIIVQAAAGLRLGELIALRQQDIDFLRRTLRIEHQFAPATRVRADPKTPRSRRTVPLPQTAVDALAAHMAKYPPLEDGTLFSNSKGRPWSHHWYGARIFKAAAAKAGLPETVVPHDLRHFYASSLLAGGEPVTVVAERLGHTNPSVLMATYAHFIEPRDDRTRSILDAAFQQRAGLDLDRSDSQDQQG